MDPLYLMIYLVVALMLVVGVMFSCMLYMVLQLKGLLRESKKHSRLFIRLTRHLHTSIVTGYLTPAPGSTRSGSMSPTPAPAPFDTDGLNYTLEATKPVSRVRPGQ